MKNTQNLLQDTPTGLSRRANLKRGAVPVSSHAVTEIQRAACSFESQPRTVAGHSGDRPPDPETLRKEPPRLHQILIQGNLFARLSCDVDTETYRNRRSVRS
jgi:hypothetical protein